MRESWYNTMKQYTDLEYLKLSKFRRGLHKLAAFFLSIPRAIAGLFVKIGLFLKNAALAVGREIKDIFLTFKNGDWKTRLSFFIMGFGNLSRGQILRGVLFLLFQAVFIFFMVKPTGGLYWLSMLPSLGKEGPGKAHDPVYDTYVTAFNDNSFQILLYGVLTIFFIIACVITWRINVRQNKLAQQILDSGKPLKSGKDDLRSMVDDNFHKTLLALPLAGILIFTVMPIVFMILVAFTNYDGAHDGYTNALFTWVGLENINTMLGIGAGSKVYAATFGEILLWTLMWAFFATFTNYFLGMLVAMMINKKGIQFKKGWRTILVMTIAIPQFISLLYVSKMFAQNGMVNQFLQSIGVLKGLNYIPFLSKEWPARISVILINIWIGIPYVMLIATGILMNIPQDLYESAKIDGASGWKQYTKITLPYMLFITGPYLLTTFTSNMNNFNVIYLLTSGGLPNPTASSAAGSVGFTDLLITWLFKITTGAESQYYFASVIGILVFIVVAIISLVVYNLLPSVKNEEDFQ